ncbi:MAG: nitrous oxide reductase accessory protein NosL [Halioglobus sp.]
MRILFKLGIVLPLSLLLACGETVSVAVPSPRELSRDAIGYFCQMTVVEHMGPKGQIILRDRDEPLWFTSVRDAIAFTAMPGEPRNIAALYVTDIGLASWDNPEAGTWVDGHKAWYVVDSDRTGGMGAPEFVPFGKKEDADRFVTQYGGEIVSFNSLPK